MRVSGGSAAFPYALRGIKSIYYVLNGIDYYYLCIIIYFRDAYFNSIHNMKQKINETIRARRLALGLSQIEAARRSGIQQRQVSLFERGGDVTLSTLLKLAQALDVELMPVPREDTAKLESLLKAKRGPAPSASSPSLLDRYQVKDDAEQSNG
jgi:transcriptional regulator with XRE-family HTH domain